MTVSDRSTPCATADRLLARGIPKHGTPEVAAAGAEHVFADLFGNLSEWVGVAGCRALFNRALVLSAPLNPVLTGVRYRSEAEPHLDHLAENAAQYGTEATAEAATVVLAAIVAMLAGLVGEDVAMSLLSETLLRARAPDPTTASGAAFGTAHPTEPQTGHGDIAS
ncbi:MAG: hypothetical protein ABI194_04495 [Gemmatimonadaceae bacterium]